MQSEYYDDGLYSTALKQAAEEYLLTCFNGTLNELRSPEFGYIALGILSDSPYVFDNAGWGVIESTKEPGDDDE